MGRWGGKRQGYQGEKEGEFPLFPLTYFQQPNNLKPPKKPLKRKHKISAEREVTHIKTHTHNNTKRKRRWEGDRKRRGDATKKLY